MTSAKICNIGCEICALITKADKQERNASSRRKQLKKAKEIISKKPQEFYTLAHIIHKHFIH